MTTPELFESFYKDYSKEYPEITLSEMRLICTAPFQMMKEKMMEGNLEDIRIQHMFVARVSVARVIKHLKQIYQRKDKGNITLKEFERVNEMLLTHIKDNPLKFRKYEERIKGITKRV